MPEGPEVRRAADRVERAVSGPLLSLTLWRPDLEETAERLRAAGLDRAETGGKATVLRFGDGWGIYVHLQLYGRWRFGRTPPRTRRALRLALVGPRGGAFLYSATDLALLEPGESHPYLHSLGPDPLQPGVGPREVELALERVRGRALGAALLDPSVVAGLGNYLRAEILWEAGVAPTRRWRELDPAARARVVAAVLAVPQRSLRGGGVTLPPEIPATPDPGRRRRRHAVYGRAGLPCPRCEAPVERAPVGGRAMFHCPGCQG